MESIDGSFAANCRHVPAMPMQRKIHSHNVDGTAALGGAPRRDTVRFATPYAKQKAAINPSCCPTPYHDTGGSWITGPTIASAKHKPNTSSSKNRGDEASVTTPLPGCRLLAVRDVVEATMRISCKVRSGRARRESTV